MEFAHLTEEDALRAVAKYRERFQTVGLFENQVYHGVPEMLKRLKAKGLHMAIASSKPTVFVERILEHFKIRDYFEVVVGSELDGTRVAKAEVVQEALRQLFHGKTIQKNKVYMIGDRVFDVQGARALGVESVGVTYGYGGMEELLEAHADYIVRSVEELKRFLLRGFEDLEKELSPVAKLWMLALPFFLFLGVRLFVRVFGQVFLSQLGITLGGESPTQLETNLYTFLTGAGFLAGGLAIFRIAKGAVKRTVRDMYLTHLTWDPKSSYVLLILSTIGLSMGTSMLMGLAGLTGASESYQQVAQVQGSASLWVSLIVYGLISPASEELLFRGLLYGYLRRFLGIRSAIVASAILFGIYHGNMVQAVYAVLMGYLLAYAYEYFGSFKVPVAMHILMNVLALLLNGLVQRLSANGTAQNIICSWPVCLILLAAGLVSVVLLCRRKRVF